MQSLYDFQRTPTRLADRLPYFGIVATDPCVIRHKDGSLQHSLRLGPPDLDAQTATALRAQANKLNNVLRRLGTDWGLFLDYTKRRVAAYPEATWPNTASAAADAARRQFFLTSPHYRLETTLTIVWKPRAVFVAQAQRWMMTSQGGQADTTTDVAPFQDQVRRLTDLLAGCMAWVQPLGPEGTLGYLHARVSTEEHPLAVPDPPTYLDCLLTDREFVPGFAPAFITGLKPAPKRPSRQWQAYYTAQFLRTLTITGFPNETYPDMLAALASLPQEYRLMFRWLPLDQVDAYKIMVAKAGKWKQQFLSMKQHALKRFAKDSEPPDPDREALRNKEGLDEAMDACMSQDVTFGYLTATMTVWDDTEEGASQHLRQAERLITGKGFTCHPEHLHATEAFLSGLPGLCYPNVRRPMLNSLNFVHTCLGGVYTGPEEDTHLHAPPLMIAETAGNMPYNIVLHERGVGHTLVIGPSGAGKTMLVGALALRWQQYHALGACVRLVDKKEGLRPVTQAMEGDHYTLGAEGSVAFQPLRNIDTLHERQWSASWIDSLCTQQGLPCTPDQRRELWETLTNMAGLPVQHRTLTGLSHLVQDVGLRQVLHPFTMAGPYGTVLDAVAEPLALRAWSCFETDTLFQNPALVAPVLGVLFHQLGNAFAQRLPTFFVLDEAWRYLAHMAFRDQIEEWLRELRKLNVSVIFSTQDLNELLESPIATILLNNCPIRFFLPNKHAQESRIAQSYAQVGLTPRHLDLLATAMPQKEYMLMTTEGTRMIDLALQPIERKILAEGVVA